MLLWLSLAAAATEAATPPGRVHRFGSFLSSAPITPSASRRVTGLSEDFRRRKNRQAAEEKLKIVCETLHEAEERVIRYEERHDKILSQICSYYMVNENLEEALVGAKNAMNDALEFSVGLRNLQMEILTSYS
ncbi:unnamed protein product [Fraxinus pennsylvanica]|uniref:Uncharacterized protein n=1 Tax=Fraxinus pennsylvanica TaxID=56036 RepID=A0AAD2DYY6_9LAMI|nr:unnamed protein product [Fraxinus pennsylvanica]